jgi:hypothetical protein
MKGLTSNENYKMKRQNFQIFVQLNGRCKERKPWTVVNEFLQNKFMITETFPEGQEKVKFTYGPHC